MDQWQCLIRKLKEALAKHHENRPFVVALDGLSGAGKTTVADRLKQDLENSTVIHIDDHIVEKAKRYNTGNEEWFEYYQLQWNTADLKERLYDQLLSGEQRLILPYYNQQEDTVSYQELEVPADSAVIIEGIFLLREEWRQYYDFILFFDCPREVRYGRVLQRDAYIGNMEARLKKYQNRYWPAEDVYMNRQKPLELAHCIYRP